MRSREQIVSMEYSVDKNKNKAVVVASLQPRKGREPTQHLQVAHARAWLLEQGVEAGALVSGTSIHNSMDRRLGLRTMEDLQTTFVFELAQAEEEVVEEVSEVAPVEEVEEVVVEAKPKPKRTRKPRAKKSVDK